MMAGRSLLQKDNNCLVVGEIAQSHDGSLGMAHAFIDAIANTGADAVKFQTHIASAESTLSEPWRVKFSYQDATRYEYWRRMEFTEEQWFGLKEHAEERGLLFLSSPFSLEAVELLTRIGMPAWKIASGEITNLPMFERMAETGLPFLLSTGMSSLIEIDESVSWIKARGLPLIVMQCTTAYPCPPEKIGINMIPLLRERYDCAVGLSDHSGTIYPGLSAATLGISVLEVHVTLSREMFGPDVPASVTTTELRQLVAGVRFIEKMRSVPVDKDQLAQEFQPLRDLFTKSIVVNQDLNVGHLLTERDLSLKKPGTGIPARDLQNVIGRRLKRAVTSDQLLSFDDLENLE